MESVEKSVKVDYLPVDRISSLPDSLIDCILTYLSCCVDLGAVVRTSVLSKRWKCCWTRVKRLVFNLDFLDKYVSPRDLDNFVSMIDSIVARHEGPLDYFSLYSDTIGSSQGCEIDVCRWMEVFCEKRIREVSLYVVAPCLVKSLCRIFYCSSLRNLCLYYCDFARSSEFHGSTNLVSLNLECLEITAGLLETVICNSPLLRSVMLVRISIVENATVLIDAPCLETLVLSESGNYRLKEYPDLIDAYLAGKFEISIGRTCKMVSFAQAMPRVESLAFKKDALQALAVGKAPLKLPTTYGNLKKLELDELDIFSVNQLSCVFCLIRSSPNLKSLEIHVGKCYDEDSDHKWEATESYCEAQENVGIVSSLSKLMFYKLLGTKCEVKVISAFLNCCPEVETVLFKPSAYIESESEDFLFKELNKLPLPETTNVVFRSFSKYEDDDASCTSSDDDSDDDSVDENV